MQNLVMPMDSKLQAIGTAKDFNPILKNYVCIYNYVNLSWYFWAPENGVALYKMVVIPKK